MLATVPIRCMSTGIGSAASALRCMTMPTGFCSLTALCAARIARGRASATGNTIPGNSTMPRTGTMMSASGGSGGVGAPLAFCSEAVGSAASAIGGSRFFQRDRQAAMGSRPVNGAVAARWKLDPAFEAPLWKLETVNGGGLELRRIGPGPRNDQFALIDERFDLVEVDAGQGDEHEHRALGLEDVHRRLPRDRRGRRLKKLPMHPLRPREHLERFRPHPIARKIRSHRLTLRKTPTLERGQSIAQIPPGHTPEPAGVRRSTKMLSAAGSIRLPVEEQDHDHLWPRRWRGPHAQ